MDPWLWVAVISAALSGFFALTGYALRTFRRSQLEEVFGEDEAGQRRLGALDRNLSALRLNASFCRGVANILLILSMLTVFGVGDLIEPRAVGAIIVSLVIIAVLGVAIPHAWATYSGEKILWGTLPILLLIRFLLIPVTWLMQAMDFPVRRLLGVREESEENGESAKQEILHAASEGQAEGAVDAEEVEMIESVMEFGNTRAGEIITPRTDIFALSVETTWEEAASKIVEAGHTRVPIYQGDIDNIIGILYAKDMLRLVAEKESVPLRSLMRKPFYVPESKLLDDLLKEFKLRKVHLAVVLDEYGGTAGIVTIEDVLEEIVGEIADEYDQAEPALMQRVDDKTAEVDGRMYIDDLNDAMKLDIPEDEDYDTVAGLVFAELGYIPTVDEALQAYGAEFTIIAADERKITRLRVRKLEKDEEAEEE